MWHADWLAVQLKYLDKANIDMNPNPITTTRQLMAKIIEYRYSMFDASLSFANWWCIEHRVCEKTQTQKSAQQFSICKKSEFHNSTTVHRNQIPETQKSTRQFTILKEHKITYFGSSVVCLEHFDGNVDDPIVMSVCSTHHWAKVAFPEAPAEIEITVL